MNNRCNLLIYYGSNLGQWETSPSYVEYDYPSYRIPKEVSPSNNTDPILKLPTFFGYEDYDRADGKIGQITSLKLFPRGSSQKIQVRYKIADRYPPIPMKVFYEKMDIEEEIATSCWKIYPGDLFKVLADELCDKHLSSELLSPEEMINVWGSDYKNNKYRIFISHKDACKSLVTSHIKEPLENLYNVKCFVAHDDIKPGSIWEKQIINALNTADLFVGVVSSDFHLSPWINQEIGYAYKMKKRRIFLKVDRNHDPPGFMSKEQALATDWPNAAKKLYNEIQISQLST